MASLRIENDGARIRATNYWQTPHARRGHAYLSINAGALRLLVPDAMGAEPLTTLGTARTVICSRGFWREAGREGVEILADDDSEEPWALHLMDLQVDRLWTEAQRESVPFLVYSPGGLAIERTCHIRSVPRIPCGRPWSTP